MRSSVPEAILDPAAHAARLLPALVPRSALAPAFPETTASTANVHVEGQDFDPPMLHDIASASPLAPRSELRTVRRK